MLLFFQEDEDNKSSDLCTCDEEQQDILEETASKDKAVEIEARNIDDEKYQYGPVAITLSEPFKESEVSARFSLLFEFCLQYQKNEHLFDDLFHGVSTNI